MAKHTTNQTAQAIVQAALRCLEEKGIEGMTIRNIAELAQVNIAAINYHFGSKEVLFNQVLELASRNAFLDLEDYVYATEKKQLQNQLEQFASHFIDGLVQYPNTSRVLLQHLMLKPNPNLHPRFEQFLSKLAGVLEHLHGIDSTWRVMEFISCMVLFCGLSHSLEKALHLDLHQQATKQQMIAVLTKPQ